MELTMLHFVVLYSLVGFFRTEPGYSCTVWVYGQYYRNKIAKIAVKWFLRPRTLASALYLTAVACVIATMLMSFSQIFHGHPTTISLHQ
jgi:ABC-type multidrug transport system permease subunit